MPSPTSGQTARGVEATCVAWDQVIAGASPAVLANEDAFEIAPVQIATREGLMDDQVFGRTGCQRHVCANLPRARAGNSTLFERQCAQGNVDLGALLAFARCCEQDAATQGK